VYSNEKNQRHRAIPAATTTTPPQDGGRDRDGLASAVHGRNRTRPPAHCEEPSAARGAAGGICVHRTRLRTSFLDFSAASLLLEALLRAFRCRTRVRQCGRSGCGRFCE